MVDETKMAVISLVSSVRTRRKNSKKHGKNSKKTTRRATSVILRIFSELDKPKRGLSKMNLNEIVLYDERMKDGGFKAL